MNNKKTFIAFLIVILFLGMTSCKSEMKEGAGSTEVYYESEPKDSVDDIENKDIVHPNTNETDLGTLNEQVDDNQNEKEQSEENNISGSGSISDSEEAVLKEKDVIYTSITKIKLTQEELIDRADLILRGKVLKKVGMNMTNPDGTLKSSDGYRISNQLITEYAVEISEFYKGDYEGETINIKIACGNGLSPELILYGENETSVLAKKIELPDFEVGEECVLLLTQYEMQPAWASGYYPTDSYGYLEPDGDGNFSNNDFNSPMTVTVESLKMAIADVIAEK